MTQFLLLKEESQLQIHNPPKSKPQVQGIQVWELLGNKTLTNADAVVQDFINPNSITLYIYLPTVPIMGKNFVVINEPSSLGKLNCNGTEISPGEQWQAIWNGIRWLEL
jgi:hypothetical protein